MILYDGNYFVNLYDGIYFVNLNLDSTCGSRTWFICEEPSTARESSRSDERGSLSSVWVVHEVRVGHTRAICWSRMLRSCAWFYMLTPHVMNLYDWNYLVNLYNKNYYMVSYDGMVS